jgi:uncharacterized protein YecA (UPF0149 family)
LPHACGDTGSRGRRVAERAPGGKGAIMGAMGDAIAAYAQPLIDATDGSEEQVQRAVSVAMVCWNLALTPAEEREARIADMRATLKMDDEEFADFRGGVIDPMIRRQHELFSAPNGFAAAREQVLGQADVPPLRTVVAEKYPGTGRNEPCPCKSGKKYKRCCGG